VLLSGSAKANDALSISLVVADSGGSKTVSTFHPKFTYPIFGDDESIFGYQGLKIQLRYHACDMRPGLQINYDKKFKPVGETSATDIKAVLEEFLPKSEWNSFYRAPN
jgi:histone acetyltransferase 1